MPESRRWRVALKGNAHRGMNRALGMENLYGTTDHLWFRTEEQAQAVVDALAAAGYPCHTNEKKEALDG